MSHPSIRYVADTGDDTNDGLSWDSPKKTLLAAYDALPTTGGTIYLAGLNVRIGGPGLWLCGPGDPAYAAQPYPWRRQKPVTIKAIGTTGSNGIGGGPNVQLAYDKVAGFEEVSLWLAGTSAAFRFEGLGFKYPKIAARIGVGSDGHREGVGDRNSASGIHFDNCIFQIDQQPGKGPTIDIGHAFWLWFYDCAISGNSAEPLDSDLRAAILANPGKHPNGQQGAGAGFVVERCNVARGGIRYTAGGGQWGLVVKDVTLEGNFNDPVQPVVDIRYANGYGSAQIERVYQADAPGSLPAVRVAAAVPPEAVHVIDCGSIEGPATVHQRYPANYSTLVASPPAQRQLGFWQGRVSGQHDAARRQFGPVAVRFPNLAPHDTATWGAKVGGSAVTTGQPAPDGSLNAARMEVATGLGDCRLYRVNRPVAVGDRVIAGCWINGHGTQSSFNLQVAWAHSDVLFSHNARGYMTGDLPIQGDGEWHWVTVHGKVASTPRTTSELILAIRCEAGKPRSYFAPILLHVPSGVMSDNEAAEFVQQLQTYPDGAPVGSRALLRGARLWSPEGVIA
jgi:hypothetical protein